MKVLLVEDDPMILQALKVALERDHLDVVTASNGNEALEHLSTQKIDVVVTDIIMPDKEGIETIATIKRDYADIKIIAMSSGGRSGLPDLLEMAKKIGANAVLKKPFKSTELLEKIRELYEEDLSPLNVAL